MNLHELVKLVKDINGTAEDLCKRKNKDYSRDDDVHANFHQLAALCTILGVDASTPQGCMEFFCVVKLHRLFKLVNAGGKPANESLFDTVADDNVYKALLIGYADAEK